MAEPKAMVMPSLETPEVSSTSNEPREVKAEIPSFNMPTFDVPTFGSSFEVPTFDLPTFEMETEPQKSAFTYTPEPKVESMPEPEKEMIETTVELPDDFDPFLYEDEMMDFDDGVIGLTADDGIRKFIFKEGIAGKQPGATDRVTVHYEGMLDDGTVFDSSYGGEPFTFDLGKGQVIDGWEIGIASMLLGEKAELTIESDYGYGKDGMPPVIPSYATLIFDVELVGFEQAVDQAEDVQVTVQAV